MTDVKVPEGSGHLVLTRREGETIRIGDDILVSITKVSHGRVRVSVIAPKDVNVIRGEVADETKAPRT